MTNPGDDINCFLLLWDIPFEIDDHIEVMPTPGFSHQAVSVMVHGTQLGTVAIAGKRKILHFMFINNLHSFYFTQFDVMNHSKYVNEMNR